MPWLKGQEDGEAAVLSASVPEHVEAREDFYKERRLEGAGKSATVVTVRDAILLLAKSLEEDCAGDAAAFRPDGSWVSDDALEPLTDAMRQRATMKLARELEVFYGGVAPEKVIEARNVAQAHISDPDQLNASLLISYGCCLPLDPPALERAQTRADLMGSERLLRELREKQEAEEQRKQLELREVEAQQERHADECERRIAALVDELQQERGASAEMQQRMQDQILHVEQQLVQRQQQLGQELVRHQNEQQRLDDELREHFKLQQSILEATEDTDSKGGRRTTDHFLEGVPASVPADVRKQRVLASAASGPRGGERRGVAQRWRRASFSSLTTLLT